MIILETTRLVLKTIEKEDSQVLYDLVFSDIEIIQSTLGKVPFTLEETKKFIYKNFCKNNAIIGLAPLFEKRTGQIVGLAGTLENKELGKDCFEIYCIIAKDYQNNEYASEVIQSEIVFLKKRLKQKKAFVLIDTQDEISKKIFSKMRLSFEKDIILENRGEKEVYSKNL